MVRRFVVIVGVMAAAGCAQLAGIDHTSDEARGGNTVTVTRVSIGTTVETAPQALDGLQATYLVANPDAASGFDRVLAANQGQGRWAADLPQPAAVKLVLPDGLPRLFSFANRALAVPYVQLEHPGRMPAPPGAMLSLTLVLDEASTTADAYQILTIGSWSRRALSTAELPVGSVRLDAFRYAYDSSTSVSGRAGLDRLTSQDLYLVLRHTGAALTGFGEARVEQTGDDAVGVTMARVVADQTLDVTLDPAQIAARFAAVQPAVPVPATSWVLTAAPGVAVAQAGGVPLHRGTVMAGDIGVTMTYGNPFAARGWGTVLTLTSTASRSFTPAGGTLAATLGAALVQRVDPTSKLALTLPAALPGSVTFDGTALTTDGQVFAAPTRFVRLAFTAPPAATPGTTLHELELYDLVADAGMTVLEPRLVLNAIAAEPRFDVPPEHFQAGHSYLIRAQTTVADYPAIGDGDLITRRLPSAQSYVDIAIAVTP